MNTDQNLPPDSIAPVNAVGESFVDRRDPGNQRQSAGFERRQFTNSMSEYSEEAAELGRAVDQYKLIHRRRFINYEELLSILHSIGYSK